VKSVQELLAQLADAGANLWVESDRLQIRAPKGVITEVIREQLTRYKPEIIRLLQKLPASQAEEPTLVLSRAKECPGRLSPEQERLWLVEQVRGDASSYNLVQGIRLSGKLDRPRLEKSIERIIQRHEALRTTIISREGRPHLQIRHFSVSLPLETGCDFRAVVDDEANRSFDTTNGPLWRFRLLQLGTDEYLLTIALHHLSSDVLSLSWLLRELVEHYEAIGSDRPVALPPVEMPYTEFARQQQERLSSSEWENERQYWRQYLQNIPENLDLPTDRPRLPSRKCQGKYHTFHLSPELWTTLKQWAVERGITPATFLLATFEIFLSLACQQEETVIGFPTAGRFHPSLEKAIGFFAYPLALRARVTPDETFLALLERVRGEMLAVFAHQELPFGQVVESLRGQRTYPRSPLFQVLFSLFLGKQLATLRASELTFSPLPEATRSPTDLDLLWSLYEVDGVLNGVVGYDSQLFEPATIEQFVCSYEMILTAALQQPETPVREFRLSPALTTKIDNPSRRSKKNTVAIAATFTAEPLADSLHFWFEELDLDYRLQFAPYQQVFQALLDERGLLSANHGGINLILLRWEDWFRYSSDAPVVETLRKNVADLADAITTALNRSPIPTFVYLCPSPLQETYPELEKEWFATLSFLEGVYPIAPRDFPTVPERDDPLGDEIGHIPYTPVFYTAIGSLIARKLHALLRLPYKVLVVDGDYTLWQGVCGEEGVEGIQIPAPYRQFQHFLRQQQREGLLLCLCSKNAEEDVRQVFESHPDMILRWEDLAGWRVNWQPKSENIEDLARELQLGLDSLIFIDDNPVEIAEVSANCPEVLALPFPGKSEEIGQFLERVWAFDRLKVTAEDRQRAAFYQQNSQRQQLRSASMTLADFIERLELRVTIAPMSPEQVARVAQLTERTNQFNTTGRRRDESEIYALHRSGALQATVVEVGDRFGDYGLVGVIFTELTKKAVRVDSFLLSCRTLGRGVEHRMVAVLGEQAQMAGREWIEIPYRVTGKNQPVLDFFRAIEGIIENEDPGDPRFLLPALIAGSLEYHSKALETTPVPKRLPSALRLHTEQSQRIIETLSDPITLWPQIQARGRRSKRDHSPEFIEPRTALERTLAELWREFLPVDRVGVRDNFFELGGDSILTVQILAKAYRIGLVLTPTQLFENPTLEQLAAVVTQLTPEACASGAILPLSPIQRDFLARNPHPRVSPCLWPISPSVAPALLERAAREVVERHEILHSRLVQNDQGESYLRIETGTGERLWQRFDLSSRADDERETVLAQTLETLGRRAEDHGDLFSIAFFDYGDRLPGRFALLTHPILLDMQSQVLILGEIGTAYQQLEGREIANPPLTLPYRLWVERVIEQASPPPFPLEESPQPAECLGSHKTSLSLQETPLLSPELHQAYNTRPEELLLTALLSSLPLGTGETSLLIDVEYSARQDNPDLSRTVGWTSDLISLDWKSQDEEEIGASLISLKERFRSRQRGTKEENAGTDRAPFRFSYLGPTALTTLSPPFLGSGMSFLEADNSYPRGYRLEIEVSLAGEYLEMHWRYERRRYTASTIATLARDTHERLQALVRHCLTPGVGGYTPTDFPDANLSSDELAHLLTLLD
jgi:FkbH-like protein/non-ribosomal peptide synthase protein (TIGR01720 family)